MPFEPLKLNSVTTGLSLNVATPNQSDMDLSKQYQSRPMFLDVPIAEIDFFEDNPRRIHDEEVYQQIKESIRTSGVQQAVYITKRPGASRYVLAQGGNTRLKILHELFAETNDPRFSAMPCVYQLYSNDADLHIAHVVENEQRAEMCFWDKACAYIKIKQHFQQDLNRQISLRELGRLFTQRGLPISHTMLSLFIFAYEQLDGLNESAYGLSHHKVQDLRKLYKEFQAAFKENQSDENELLPIFWQEQLQNWDKDNSDKQNWDNQNLLASLKEMFVLTFQFSSLAQENQLNEQENAAAVFSDSETQKLLKDDSPKEALNSEAQNDETSIQNCKSTEAIDKELDVSYQSKQQNVDVAITKADKAILIQKLHQVIKRWLDMVNLSSNFQVHTGFRYHFYLEYPNFESINNDKNHYFIIDNLHENAGNVFTYLSKLSGQENYLFSNKSNYDKDCDNPILSLPDSSKLKIAYSNPEKLDEYQQLGIGDRNNLVDQLIAWQTEKCYFVFTEIIDEIIELTRKINQTNG